jgi:hypothetical protein
LKRFNGVACEFLRTFDLSFNEKSMKIIDVIKSLKASEFDALQISKRNGIISSTWLLYKKGDLYFYFDVNQKVEFIDKYEYSEEELINEFKESDYLIDLSIN